MPNSGGVPKDQALRPERRIVCRQCGRANVAGVSACIKCGADQASMLSERQAAPVQVPLPQAPAPPLSLRKALAETRPAAPPAHVPWAGPEVALQERDPDELTDPGTTRIMTAPERNRETRLEPGEPLPRNPSRPQLATSAAAPQTGSGSAGGSRPLPVHPSPAPTSGSLNAPPATGSGSRHKLITRTAADGTLEMVYEDELEQAEQSTEEADDPSLTPQPNGGRWSRAFARPVVRRLLLIGGIVLALVILLLVIWPRKPTVQEAAPAADMATAAPGKPGAPGPRRPKLPVLPPLKEAAAPKEAVPGASAPAGAVPLAPPAAAPEPPEASQVGSGTTGQSPEPGSGKPNEEAHQPPEGKADQVAVPEPPDHAVEEPIEEEPGSRPGKTKPRRNKKIPEEETPPDESEGTDVAEGHTDDSEEPAKDDDSAAPE